MLMIGIGKITQPFRNLFGGILGKGGAVDTKSSANGKSILSRGAMQKISNPPANIKALLPFDQSELLNVIQALKEQKLNLINGVKVSIEKLTNLSGMGEAVKESLENAGINTNNINKVHKTFVESEKIGFGKIMQLANTLPDIKKALNFYAKQFGISDPELEKA